MGGFQAIQPLLRKEGVRPALMVPSPTSALAALAFSENAAQPHPGPAVDILERRPVAVLEVFKPAPERRIDLGDDRSKAEPGGPLRLRSDRVLEFL